MNFLIIILLCFSISANANCKIKFHEQDILEFEISTIDYIDSYKTDLVYYMAVIYYDKGKEYRSNENYFKARKLYLKKLKECKL